MSDYVYKNQHGVLAVLDRANIDKPKEIRYIYPDYSVFPMESKSL